ncbi:MAG: hypothetical protein DME37_02710 [Verrucomicrobia bacterium]|nr:MAG: hypothetical protein DME37_02710 [Verrucomicrobiota bacterium]
MANKYCRTHRHLRRLDRVWLDPPIFFVTACTRKRKAMLASEQVAEILIDEWQSAQQRHGCHVGRYVIMPDHVHLFCTPNRNSTSLSGFVGAWKRWSSRRISKMPRTASTATTQSAARAVVRGFRDLAGFGLSAFFQRGFAR